MPDRYTLLGGERNAVVSHCVRLVVLGGLLCGWGSVAEAHPDEEARATSVIESGAYTPIDVDPGPAVTDSVSPIGVSASEGGETSSRAGDALLPWFTERTAMQWGLGWASKDGSDPGALGRIDFGDRLIGRWVTTRARPGRGGRLPPLFLSDAFDRVVHNSVTRLVHGQQAMHRAYPANWTDADAGRVGMYLGSRQCAPSAPSTNWRTSYHQLSEQCDAWRMR